MTAAQVTSGIVHGRLSFPKVQWEEIIFVVIDFLYTHTHRGCLKKTLETFSWKVGLKMARKMDQNHIAIGGNWCKYFPVCVCVGGMKTLNVIPVSQSEFIFSNFFLESFTDAVGFYFNKSAR